MKKLYLVGGTMGVGKSTACRILRDLLPDSVLLDGDWCWDMHPFRVNDETKAMVMDNICFLLNRFLRCSNIRNIVFCWVMHQQEIIDEILSRLEGAFEVRSISLVCTQDVLTQRIERDAAEGRRAPGDVDRSVARLPLYGELNTIHVDTSQMTPEETAQYIAKL